MRPNTPGLLDQLAYEIGTDMLSDLRDPAKRDALFELLTKIPPERYSAKEWKNALCYLLAPPFPRRIPLDNRRAR